MIKQECCHLEVVPTNHIRKSNKRKKMEQLAVYNTKYQL